MDEIREEKLLKFDFKIDFQKISNFFYSFLEF